MAEGDAFEARPDSEDAPLIKTTLTGLDANQDYNIYVYFGDLTSSECNIYAGLLSDSLTMFDKDSPSAEQTMDYEGTVGQFRVLLGTTAPDASSNLDIFIDSEQGGGYHRTWYDGVGYEVIPEPATLILLVLGGVSALLRRRRCG